MWPNPATVGAPRPIMATISNYTLLLAYDELGKGNIWTSWLDLGGVHLLICDTRSAWQCCAIQCYPTWSTASGFQASFNVFQCLYFVFTTATRSKTCFSADIQAIRTRYEARDLVIQSISHSSTSTYVHTYWHLSLNMQWCGLGYVAWLLSG